METNEQFVFYIKKHYKTTYCIKFELSSNYIILTYFEDTNLEVEKTNKNKKTILVGSSGSSKLNYLFLVSDIFEINNPILKIRLQYKENSNSFDSDALKNLCFNKIDVGMVDILNLFDYVTTHRLDSLQDIFWHVSSDGLGTLCFKDDKNSDLVCINLEELVLYKENGKIVFKNELFYLYKGQEEIYLGKPLKTNDKRYKVQIADIHKHLYSFEDLGNFKFWLICIRENIDDIIQKIKGVMGIPTRDLHTYCTAYLQKEFAMKYITSTIYLSPECFTETNKMETYYVSVNKMLNNIYYSTIRRYEDGEFLALVKDVYFNDIIFERLQKDRENLLVNLDTFIIEYKNVLAKLILLNKITLGNTNMLCFEVYIDDNLVVKNVKLRDSEGNFYGK